MSGMHLGQRVSFLCDQNLGRLSKWLRMMGFDTLYMRGQDQKMIEDAVSDGRVFLTRLHRMEKRTDNTMVIYPDRVHDQMMEVARAFDLQRQARPLSLCSICNERLVGITMKEASRVVPEYVFATHASFSRCPVCKRIYWKGTHENGIRDEIASILHQGR
ncbi:MAG: Mut7-C RNAse domain-containing protein [Thermodesulfobacteriota bacterium]|nr:Mut7-C RNAse domain-containing protein [Thermodesulfobacteriota bacterium]